MPIKNNKLTIEERDRKKIKVITADVISKGRVPVESASPASEEQKKEVFYNFGLLSTLFAELEVRVQHLLGTICRFQGLIEYHLTEDNTLDRNMQLLNKINRILKFEPSKIKMLSNSLGKVRETRNKMIHGRWDIFLDKQGELVIAVWDYKIKVDEKDNHSHVQRGWQHTFIINDFVDLIEKIIDLNALVVNLTTEAKAFYKEKRNGLYFEPLP